jgi:hypothetical protein
VDDLLSSYERTPLGGWPIPATSERTDPWIRLLLLGRKQPIVIDIAVFIDGRSFRDVREAWIEQLIADAKRAAADGTSKDANVNSVNNEAAGEGTNTSAAASNGKSSSSDDGPVSTNVSGVAVQGRKAPTMRDRLMNHLTMTGAEGDREEIGWLLAESGAGPGIVVLSPGLSWQRATLAPLLTYLDENADGALAASEFRRVEALMKRADYNGDEVVEVDEIRRATTNEPAPIANGHPLVVRLDANTDWGSLDTTVQTIYPNRKNSSVLDRAALLAAPADFALRVDFNAAPKRQSTSGRVTALSIKEGLSAGDAVVASNDTLSIEVGGDHMEFAAAQPLVESGDDLFATQIAIGAVVDGNPLLRLVDRVQDGRLTLRERQQLPGLLAALDRNSDGDVSSDEIPAPIRVAVTLGPHVHNLLAKPAGSVRSIAPRESAPAPPEWFASMDKNNDRDLSLGEFLGTTEQFRQFDSDGDGLLSPTEAQKLNAGQ